MENILSDLGIPMKHLTSTDEEDKFIAVVPKFWIRKVIVDSVLEEFEEKNIINQENENNNCKSILIKVLAKQKHTKALPLPVIRNLPTNTHETPLLFSQLIHYISHSNYKNLCKDAFRKHFFETYGRIKDRQITLSCFDDVLRHLILRVYGCRIINICNNSDSNPKVTFQDDSFITHPNILPAICCVETLNSFYTFHTNSEYNLNDCLNFSPTILEKSYTKPLFVIYQLMQSLKYLHNRSLTLGNVTLNNIYIEKDLWIYIFPQLSSNLHTLTDVSKDNIYNLIDSGERKHFAIKPYDKIEVNNQSLEQLCELWIMGQISNFTYITSLNNFSGRKLGDPNRHHVFPWVTDFTTSDGKNWRDLKKSKYRLNKGDRQLDLTYETSELHKQVPHHVSDVLSSITYYVYTARKTPKSILCKNVRTVWVPEEYPNSIQRMQQWSPDECIPEFFTDPSVFMSIHDDLDDLEVPTWCSGPEELVERHRDILESNHVSERLHHWIDLTFGYKLSGSAAVKAKNVCLHLVDDHVNLTKSGIVQLFHYPHPCRASNNIIRGQIPTKCTFNFVKPRSRHRSNSSMEVSRSEEDFDNIENLGNVVGLNRSPLGLSRIMSRSRSSLNDEANIGRSPFRSASVGPKLSNFTSHVSKASKDVISFSKEFKPEQSMELLEKKSLFFSKSFHSEHVKLFENFEESSKNDSNATQNVHKAFKNEEYEINNGTPKTKLAKTQNSLLDQHIMVNYSDLISSKRITELQTLGCLIVEIFLFKHLRSLASNNTKMPYKERLKSRMMVLKNYKNEIAPCVSYIAHLLLQPDCTDFQNFSYPVITELGLPFPSTHLLLEPSLSCLIPFRNHFPRLYAFCRYLKEFESISMELEMTYHFDCDGTKCAEYETLEKTKILLMQNVSECKVKTCAKVVEEIIDDVDIATDTDIIEILLSYIKQLIEDPPTSVLAAWYLFDLISRVLGPNKTVKHLQDSILNLYEIESIESSFLLYGKIAKLYHHSFLLRLMVRFGLKSFLEDFVPSLVEAVGCYKEYPNDFGLHTHSKKNKKMSHLKVFDDTEDSEKNTSLNISAEKDLQPQTEDNEIFQFEDERNDNEQLKSLIEHLELNVTEDLPFNHSTAEEALDVSEAENIEHSLSSENLSFTNIEQERKGSIISPSIVIPRSSITDFGSISCEIGSQLQSESNKDNSECSGLTGSSKTLQRVNRETKISDMSSDSLVWLSHRLGPVLTARYLSRNLLKMLTLCYVGKENLMLIFQSDVSEDLGDSSVALNYVMGDRNASKVFYCLTSIAGLYGEEFILLQYIPHMSELIALCKKKLTSNLEGGLVSCLALLKHIIPHLSDSTLMDHLQDIILKRILHPTMKILGSVKFAFPSGYMARNTLARKYLDALHTLALRIGADMTRTHLSIPTLQDFFLTFDKTETTLNKDLVHRHKTGVNDYLQSRQDEDGKVNKGRLLNQNDTHFFGSSFSTNIYPNSPEDNTYCFRALQELKLVFTPSLAYEAYILFLRHIGANLLEEGLKNHDQIKYLCYTCEKKIKRSGLTHSNYIPMCQRQESPPVALSSSIGSNVTMIGNRIDIQFSENIENNTKVNMVAPVNNKADDNNRNLRGNWLAYWGHEIGRSDKDTSFNFKQIKLQSFTGHANSIKCLYVLDNENSFISGSRDRTIKLWSLRSQGDGSSTSSCQWTYIGHKKSVLSIAFIESLRLVASCDSDVHVWDPFMGAKITHLESPKHTPVNVLKSTPAPSTLVFTATTDGTLKVVDIRLCDYVYELKISPSPAGLIRCLAVSPSGNWIAAGQASGYITVLDTRTGLIVSTWRAHEEEVLQIVAFDDHMLVSSSLDQNISVWNVSDGKIKFFIRGNTEPVHCLNVYNSTELISGTTSNRIGVYASNKPDAVFSSTKLRPDAFKGLLTSMSVLPLNRMLLLGADSGNIFLLC